MKFWFSELITSPKTRDPCAPLSDCEIQELLVKTVNAREKSIRWLQYRLLSVHQQTNPLCILGNIVYKTSGYLQVNDISHGAEPHPHLY